MFARLRTVTPSQKHSRKRCDCFVTRRIVVHERQRVRSTTQRAVDRGMLQHWLGYMYCETYICDGRIVAQDHAEALQWYKLAAAQGLKMGLRNVGMHYEEGRGVAADRAEAIRWYKRAAAARCSQAAAALKRLGAGWGA